MHLTIRMFYLEREIVRFYRPREVGEITNRSYP